MQISRATDLTQSVVEKAQAVLGENALHTIRDDNDIITDIGHFKGRNKFCQATTLSAWIAFLSCFMIVLQLIIRPSYNLLMSEQFWRQTERLIDAITRCGDVTRTNNVTAKENSSVCSILVSMYSTWGFFLPIYSVHIVVSLFSCFLSEHVHVLERPDIVWQEAEGHLDLNLKSFLGFPDFVLVPFSSCQSSVLGCSLPTLSPLAFSQCFPRWFYRGMWSQIFPCLLPPLNLNTLLC